MFEVIIPAKFLPADLITPPFPTPNDVWPGTTAFVNWKLPEIPDTHPLEIIFNTHTNELWSISEQRLYTLSFQQENEWEWMRFNKKCLTLSRYNGSYITIKTNDNKKRM